MLTLLILVQTLASWATADLGVGSQACMQIYTVPKYSVTCEPTTEVQDELLAMRNDLQQQTDALSVLNSRIDLIDPEKPRELTEEMQRHLAKVDEVSETQAEQNGSFRKLEYEISLLREKMEKMETSERAEIKSLIDLQTELIKVTLAQSNVSVHQEYVEQLTTRTRELTDRLQQLQLDITNSLHDSQTKMQQSVDEWKLHSSQSIQALRTEVMEKINELSAERNASWAGRSSNRSRAMEQELDQLMEALTSMREHQARFEEERRRLTTGLDTLSRSLLETREEKAKLEKTVEDMQVMMNAMREDMEKCCNMTFTSKALQLKATDSFPVQEMAPKSLHVSDCQESLKFHDAVSGVYPVRPTLLMETFDVFCEMTDEGEGWTVIQRRTNGKTGFYLGWEDYKRGFGDIDNEYWLGLEKIHALIKNKDYMLQVDLEDFSNNWFHAIYDNFSVSGADDYYRLHVAGYHGTAGDALSYHNGMTFATHDLHNAGSGRQCAEWAHGAWWYNDCFHSNLNGRYYKTGKYWTNTGWGDGIVWRHIKGTNFYSLKSTVMKIKPVS